MTKVLTGIEILAADDREFALVDVPEWGGHVRIVSLDADQLLAYHELSAAASKGKKENPLAYLVAESCVDAEGKKAFTKADVERIAKKRPKILVRIMNAALKLNSMEEKTEDDPGNSEAGPAES